MNRTTKFHTSSSLNKHMTGHTPISFQDTPIFRYPKSRMILNDDFIIIWK